MTRSARRVLVAGAALLAGAWLVAAPTSPPLYDGIGGAAEPYRYLTPPPGATRTVPPAGVTKTLAVSNGSSAAAFLNTDEQPPQVQLLVGQGAFSVPAGTTAVTITIKPIAPPQPLPSAIGHFDGNVYSIEATGDKGGSIGISTAVTPPTVVLRGPAGSSSASVIRLGSSGGWTALHTVPIGSSPDMVAATTTELGDFGLALGGGSGSSSTAGGGGGGSSGGGFPVVAVVIPVVVLALVALLLAIRLSRRSQAPPARRRPRR